MKEIQDKAMPMFPEDQMTPMPTKPKSSFLKTDINIIIILLCTFLESLNIKMINLDSVQIFQCVVCLGEGEGQIVALSCGHVFH